MTDTEGDEFHGIIELARSRNPVARLELLEKPNVTLAARLRSKDVKRFFALEAMLTGWVGLRPWREAVRKRFAKARKDHEDEVEINKAEERLAEAEEQGRPIISEGKPVEIARDFKVACIPDLIHVAGEWLAFDHNHYRPHEPREIRSRLQSWMHSGVNSETGNPTFVNRKVLDDVMDALANTSFHPAAFAKPPTWLKDEEGDWNPKLCLPMENGLLNVVSTDMQPNTSRLFSRNGVSYAYDDFAPLPYRWLDFLNELWPDETESHACLQEAFGIALTGLTKYQKIWLLLGPPRAGKGTILRVLTSMVGEANVAGTPLRKLGTEFGLKQLLGKSLLTVGDARLGKNADVGAITETLLNISGEDTVSVGRKFLDDVSERLNARIWIAGNLDLALPDQSGALGMRYIPLVLTRTFHPHEQDPDLEDKLVAELPSILAWALAGLRRFLANGERFTISEAGRKRLQAIGRHGSPVQTFIKEVCVLDAAAEVAKVDLFEAFEGWSREVDLTSRHTLSSFARELSPASGFKVESLRTVASGERQSLFAGIRLKEEYVGYKWAEDDEY